MSYVIIIYENEQPKYLFNTRMLVHDCALAKQFSSALLARRYFKKSRFTQCEYVVVPNPQQIDADDSPQAN